MSPGGSSPYLALAWGTLTTEFYELHRSEPDHPMVKLSLKNGLPQSKIISDRTPEEALIWLKEFHNSFGGSAFTIPDYLGRVAPVKAEFKVFMQSTGLTSSGT